MTAPSTPPVPIVVVPTRQQITDEIAGIVSRAVNAFAAGAGIEARTTPGDCSYTAEAIVLTADDLSAAPDAGGGEGLHPATADLVDRFAAALREKLAKAEAKYGYSDGWLDDQWRGDLVRKLAEHVQKGDPRDVAAYCAFAWHHGWSITPPAGEATSLAVALVQHLAPDQGDRSSEAFGLAVRLQAALSAASTHGGGVSQWGQARSLFVAAAEKFMNATRYEEASAIADGFARDMDKLYSTTAGEGHE